MRRKVPFGILRHTEPPTIGLIHGFTQNRRCWGSLPAHLAPGWSVVAVDIPGHGAASNERPGFDEAATGLADTIGAGVHLGYSLGGRLALHAAIRRPEAVRALVLISASPGIADAGERAARQRADDELADRIERIGVERFVEEWLARPMFAGLDRSELDLDERRSNTAAGLASSLRLLGTGVQPPAWDRLHELTMPVLVVAGERDAKFVDIAQRMASGIGASARLAIVPEAGHTVHRERPEAFARVLDDFLAGVDVADRAADQ